MMGCSQNTNIEPRTTENEQFLANASIKKEEQLEDLVEEHIEEPVIETGISLVTDDMKLEYWINETIEFDGLKIYINYSDETTKELAIEECEIGEVDTSTYGTKEMDVTYKDFTEIIPIQIVYTVTDCEEKIMYSKTSLNVRTGPATSFDSIGVLNLNQEVKVTGICDNGWSRIDYKGEVAYTSTKYLSDKKIEVQKQNAQNYSDTAKVASEMQTRPGMIGRLYIPAVGVNVALFNSFSQATTDARDSAATYNTVNMVIADHKHQGFSAMKSSVPGQTVAYINNGNSVRSYLCVEKNSGRNNETSLVDCNGASLYTKIPGGLVMYTCNSHWSDITYTCWSPM